jgi:predicted nucleic acid-binding protein
MVEHRRDTKVERTPQTLVLDASAAAKWFLKEEDTEKAVLLRDAHIEGRLNLTAPDLIVYEVANALNYHPKLTEADLDASLKELLELDLDLIPPSREFSSQTVRTARKLEISVYDASYIALSDIIATNVVTADRKLHEKISKRRQSYLLGEMGHTWKLQGNDPGRGEA